MTTPQSLNVAVIQQQCQTDKSKNLQRTAELIEQAAAEGAQLILLQELHASLYFCQIESNEYFALAEPLQGTTTTTLASLAKQHKVVIVGSIFERRAAGVFHNTAVVLDTDGSLAGFYRKMHIPDDPGFYEKYYFTPGDADGCQPIKTSLGTLGVLVCWDQWYPEAARLMALKGADLLLYPTAIGWDTRDDLAEQQRQKEAWTTIQRSHAIANHLPVLVANRTGHEPDPSEQSPGTQFWGGSFISGPQGEFLTEPLDSQTEGVLITEVPLAKTETLRQIWPYFRDRRIDAFSDLTRRYCD